MYESWTLEAYKLTIQGDKEVMSMKELILEVEELELRIAPGSASNGAM